MRKEKGFTLIELMIVVAIIGILAAIAIPKFAQLIDKAREASAKGNLGALRSAIAIYYGDNKGQWPAALNNSERFVTAMNHTFPAFIGPYMARIPRATLRRSLTAHSNDADTVVIVATGENSDINATQVAASHQGGWIYSSNSGHIRINCNCRDTMNRSDFLYSNYGHEER